MKNVLLIGILLLSFVRCEKNTTEIVNLDGMWIENSQITDTLVFDTKNSDKMFILYRGNELRNDYLLPKYLSGPYSFFINGDSINLKWGLSSIYKGRNYYFHYDSKKEEIEIGNFFIDSLSNNQILTFSKVK